MGDEIFLDTMLAVSTTDARLLDSGMESLYGFEVLTVDIGLAKLQFATGLGGNIEVIGEDARCQARETPSDKKASEGLLWME